jgi:hypothetical protein
MDAFYLSCNEPTLPTGWNFDNKGCVILIYTNVYSGLGFQPLKLSHPTTVISTDAFRACRHMPPSISVFNFSIVYNAMKIYKVPLLMRSPGFEFPPCFIKKQGPGLRAFSTLSHMEGQCPNQTRR